MSAHLDGGPRYRVCRRLAPLNLLAHMSVGVYVNRQDTTLWCFGHHENQFFIHSRFLQTLDHRGGGGNSKKEYVFTVGQVDLCGEHPFHTVTLLYQRGKVLKKVFIN